MPIMNRMSGGGDPDGLGFFRMITGTLENAQQDLGFTLDCPFIPMAFCGYFENEQNAQGQCAPFYWFRDGMGLVSVAQATVYQSVACPTTPADSFFTLSGNSLTINPTMYGGMGRYVYCVVGREA